MSGALFVVLPSPLATLWCVEGTVLPSPLGVSTIVMIRCLSNTKIGRKESSFGLNLHNNM